MAGSFILFATFRPRMALPRVAGAGPLGVALGPAFVPALGFGLRAVVGAGLGLLTGATAGAGASSGHALRHRTVPSCLSGAEDSGDDADNDDDNDGDDDGDDDYGSEGSGVNFGSRTYKQKPGFLGRAPSAQAAAAAALARSIAQTKARTAELELARQVSEARIAAFAERQERAKRKSFRAAAAHSAAENAVAAAEELEIAATAALETARTQKRAARKTAEDARFRADCLVEEDSLSSSSNAADPLPPPPSPGAGKKRKSVTTGAKGETVLTGKYIRSLFKVEVDALMRKIDDTAPTKGGRRDSVIKELLAQISKRVSQPRQTRLEGHEKQIVLNVLTFLDHLKLTPRDRLAQHTIDIVLLSVCTGTLQLPGSQRILSARAVATILQVSRHAANNAFAARTSFNAIAVGIEQARAAKSFESELVHEKDEDDTEEEEEEDDDDDDDIDDSDFLPASDSDDSTCTSGVSSDDSDTAEEKLLSSDDDLSANPKRQKTAAASPATAEDEDIFADSTVKMTTAEPAVFSRVKVANVAKAQAALLRTTNPFAKVLTPRARQVHRSKYDLGPIQEWCHNNSAIGAPYLDTANLKRTKLVRMPSGAIQRHAVLTQSSSKREMFENFKRSSEFQKFVAVNTRTVTRPKSAGGGSVEIRPKLCYETFRGGICGCVVKIKRRTCVQPRDENLEQAIQTFRKYNIKRLVAKEVIDCKCVWHENNGEKIRKMAASKKSLYAMVCCPSIEHDHLSLRSFASESAEVYEAANLEMAKLKDEKYDYQQSLSLGGKARPSQARSSKTVAEATQIPDAAFRDPNFESHHRRCLLGACKTCHYSSKLDVCPRHFVETQTVQVKVMMATTRAGTVTQELTKLEMTGKELFAHLIKCMEASGHDFFLNYWSRQNFDLAYQTFEPDTVIIAKDYAATMTIQPTAAVTASIPWHMNQEVILLSFGQREVLVQTPAGEKRIVTMETASVHGFSEQNSKHAIKTNYLSTTYGTIAAVKMLREKDPVLFGGKIKHLIELHDACADQYRQRRTLAGLSTILNETGLESVEDGLPNAGGFKGPHDAGGAWATGRIQAAQDAGACFTSAYSAFKWFHENECGPVSTAGTGAPGVRPYRAVTSRYAYFLVAETDATDEQRRDAAAGLPVFIIDVAKLDWDTPVTIESIGDVYSFRVCRAPAGSPAAGPDSFSTSEESKKLSPRSVWKCAACKLEWAKDTEAILPWTACWACPHTFCGKCSKAGHVETHDATHKRSYLAQIRDHSCFGKCCMPRGMAGICACQSQVEAGRWTSVQVIKLHVALSGSKKVRLAKTVEFFGRNDASGKAIVFQPAEANSPCGMTALLGAKRHEDAEDEERSVYLCLLEGPPYKLAKLYSSAAC